jgi:hypothetical protein
MNATLRSYILSFRVAELQLCLGKLGLSRNGLKAELQARLLAYFGENSSVAGRGVTAPREQHRLDSAGCQHSAATLHFQLAVLDTGLTDLQICLL